MTSTPSTEEKESIIEAPSVLLEGKESNIEVPPPSTEEKESIIESPSVLLEAKESIIGVPPPSTEEKESTIEAPSVESNIESPLPSTEEKESMESPSLPLIESTDAIMEGESSETGGQPTTESAFRKAKDECPTPQNGEPVPPRPQSGVDSSEEDKTLPPGVSSEEGRCGGWLLDHSGGIKLVPIRSENSMPEHHGEINLSNNMRKRKNVSRPLHLYVGVLLSVKLLGTAGAAFVKIVPSQYQPQFPQLVYTSRACSCIQNKPNKALKMNIIDNLEKLLIGNIFPEDEIKEEDPLKELASFNDLFSGSPKDVSIAHNSLIFFLLEWGKALEKADGSEKLTTPIHCIPLVPIPVLDEDGEEKEAQTALSASKEGGCAIIMTSGVKIMFRKTRRYLSRNEQRGMEKGHIPDRKGAKIDMWSPGGIQLIVQTVPCGEPCSDYDGKQDKLEMYRLRLLARRCDIDGDTVVKVSSERTIIRRMHEAIRIWKKMKSL